jgi:hypothetical protein
MSLFMQSRVIDGQTFTVSQLPGRIALRTLNRLGKALGPAFAALMGSAKANGPTVNLGALDFASIGGALEALFSNLSDSDLDYFLDTLLETATVDNQPLKKQIDILFMGRTDVLVRVLIFAVEVNYGNFTRALAGLAGGAQVKAQEKA